MDEARLRPTKTITMEPTIDLCLKLIPALPLAAALLVAILGAKVLKEHSHWPVIVALGLSFVCSLGLLYSVNQEQNGVDQVSNEETPVPGALSRAGYERVITL